GRGGGISPVHLTASDVGGREVDIALEQKGNADVPRAADGDGDGLVEGHGCRSSLNGTPLRIDAVASQGLEDAAELIGTEAAYRARCASPGRGCRLGADVLMDQRAEGDNRNQQREEHEGDYQNRLQRLLPSDVASESRHSGRAQQPPVTW